MLAATVVCALVAGLGSSLDAPWVFRLAVVIYFMLLAMYGSFGVARGLRAFRMARAYRRRLRDDCQTLSEELRRRPPPSGS